MSNRDNFPGETTSQPSIMNDMVSKDAGAVTEENFDPIAYIENHFTTQKRQATPAELAAEAEIDIDIPSMGEYLNGKSASNGAVAAKPVRARRKATHGESKLSAPRPRKSQIAERSSEPVIHPELSEIWEALPKSIEFLSQSFDDAVTANYYTGEFKETRQEMIRRLLDPQLSLEEVSRLLGVCPATVRRYTNRGWLQHHRTPGGQRRFRLSDVVRFVDKHGRPTEG
jgi:excisionase family DNA binding protein